MNLMISSGFWASLWDDGSTFVLFDVDGDHTFISSMKTRDICIVDAFKIP